MNWQTVFTCIQDISGARSNAPQAIVLLRAEVVATALLSAAEKEELHSILDKLQTANLYGRIALVGQLKDTLSTHAGFKARFAEYGVRGE